MDWTDRAQCAGSPQVMFPEPIRGAHADAQYDQARAICRDCPVQTECLITALIYGDEDGVWGGMAPNPRRRLRRWMIRIGVMLDVEPPHLWTQCPGCGKTVTTGNRFLNPGQVRTCSALCRNRVYSGRHPGRSGHHQVAV